MHTDTCRFWGWGAEDRDFQNRVAGCDIPVTTQHALPIIAMLVQNQELRQALHIYFIAPITTRLPKTRVS